MSHTVEIPNDLWEALSASDLPGVFPQDKILALILERVGPEPTQIVVCGGVYSSYQMRIFAIKTIREMSGKHLGLAKDCADGKLELRFGNPQEQYEDLTCRRGLSRKHYPIKETIQRLQALGIHCHAI